MMIKKKRTRLQFKNSESSESTLSILVLEPESWCKLTSEKNLHTLYQSSHRAVKGVLKISSWCI